MKFVNASPKNCPGGGQTEVQMNTQMMEAHITQLEKIHI